MMKSSLKLLKNENLLNLARFLGNKQEALNELRWLSQSSKSNSDLQNMINDRIKGKPLQYILGKYCLLKLPFRMLTGNSNLPYR